MYRGFTENALLLIVASGGTHRQIQRTTTYNNRCHTILAPVPYTQNAANPAASNR